MTPRYENKRAVGIGPLLEQFWQDIRYGARSLLRNAVFAAVSITTLALGIGMNTAVFSIVNATLIKPLPYPASQRLVWIANKDERFHFEGVMGADFVDWRQQAQSFEEMAAYSYSDATLGFAGYADQHRIVAASPELWSIVSTEPALGRLWGKGARDELVLSYSLFARRFRSDPEILGKVVTLDGRPVTVIGVLPQAFHFVLPLMSTPGLEGKEIEGFAPSELSSANQIRGRMMSVVSVVAKLKPNVTLDSARAEMEAIQARIARENPGGMYAMWKLSVEPLREKLVGSARRPLTILWVAVGFVLLIACTNIINLLLARASARDREITIRRAVGATRNRLLRQFLAEGILLALLGGAAGLALAHWAIALMIRLSPQAVPRLAEARIDTGVLIFTLAVSVVTGVLFGLSPVISFRSPSREDVFREGQRISSGPSSTRLRAVLVAAEIALAMVLLVGAGLMVRSFWRMNAYPAGFNPEQTLVLPLSLTGPGYDPAPNQVRYLDQVLARASSAPGVEAVGIENAPVRGLVDVEGQAPAPPGQAAQTTHHSVSAGYLRAIGVVVTRGRWIADAEPANVIAVNEAFARRAFGDANPIGRRIRIPGQQGPVPATIVGVTANLKYSKLDAEPEPETYIPYRQSAFLRSMNLVVRTAGSPAAVAPGLRSLVAGIDSTQAVANAKVLEDLLSESIRPRRFNMFLLGTFAVTALVMALVGIYGVIAYSIMQRTRELGVRMALGAGRSELVRMVMRQGFQIAATGVGIGLVAAMGLTRWIASLLYDVKPIDPPTYIVVGIALLAAALLATSGPAIRAALLDPMTALRYE